MSTNLTSSCPSGHSLPDVVNIPSIPTNISTVFLPSRGNTLTPMIQCCAPNPVTLAEGCYYWCKLPGNNTDAGISAWSACMSASHVLGSGENETNILGSNLVTGAAGEKRGVGWLLGMAVLVGVVVQVVSL
ncbi:hypothetical protein BKA65DRAFT_595962 [Rhexocercosporidium sp. MPI-PUGE-AT-0058]|nr:hypothetical protein BKA65DRAFT_595962 [Rhexocercosporidium sp. MPI-PUGE-AT-0058]